MRHSAPHLYHVAVVDSVWALPFSLAATSGISYLISLPRPTQMLHFGQFALPSEKQGSVKRDLIRRSRDQRSHALPPGLSQLATSFIAYQAKSFPNRRLCTITRYAIPFTIAAPETLREHFRKATIFTLSVM